MPDNTMPALGAPPAPAPQLTPAQAHAELALLKDNREFVRDFAEGRESAKARFNALTDATSGLPRPAPAPVPEPDWHTVNEAMTIEQMTPAQRENYEKLFGAPTDATAYKIDYSGFTENATPDDVVAADARFRGWLMEAKAPLETGNGIASEIRAEAERVDGMDDERFTTYSGERLNKLQLMWGDQTNANLDLANRLLDDIERARPGVKSWLAANRLGSSSGLCVLLHQLAVQRYGSASGNAAPGTSGATGRTPREAAAARLEELRSDREFGARFLTGDPRAQAELDRLQRAVLGMK